MDYSEENVNGYRKSRGWKELLTILGLIFILLTGTYFRLVGSDWGENTFMHPDERFLLMVGSALEPVSSFSEYFDTANSSLNPHNRNFGFYVYGTLPMFLARYAVQAYYGQAGLVEMLTVGRALSALADLLTVLLVFALGRRLYGRAAGLLASGFMAFMVLHIQQSHFFTMDTFITFFTILAIYFAVRVVTDSTRWKKEVPTERAANRGSPEEWSVEANKSLQAETARSDGASLHSFAPAISSPRISQSLVRFYNHPLFLLSLGFGVALGMAVASKLNAVPVAMMLPVAAGIYLLSLSSEERRTQASRVFWYVVLAAGVSILVFRIFQPYAFQGPGFFGMLPNQLWVNNIMEQRIQAGGDVDFPPAMQWARRPILFSFQNMVLWGMGFPLGILAWAGFLWMGWRILHGDWRRHLLIWGWTAFYFAWQSLQFNPTMRYQMPIYPTLAIIAAWAVVQLWKARLKKLGFNKPLSLFIGISVLGATLAWAYAFSQIYVRPFTRVEASRWIFENVPGPINLPIQTDGAVYNQMLPFPYNAFLSSGTPYQTGFHVQQTGILEEVFLPYVYEYGQPVSGRDVSLIVSAAPYGEQPFGAAFSPALPEQPLNFFLDRPLFLDQDETYYLTLYFNPGTGLLDLCGPLTVHIQTPERIIEEDIPGFEGCVSYPQSPYSLPFSLQNQGVIEEITLDRVDESAVHNGPGTLEVIIRRPGDLEILSSASTNSSFSREEGQDGYTLHLNPPLTLVDGEYYELLLELQGGPGALTIQGSPVANEGDWDDGLPLRMDAYDPYGGIYRPGLAFHMYTDDNQEKLERFLRVMDESEYIVISSSRQWGSLPRIPERFPLVTAYYRNLIGCPVEQTIEWCYRVAGPGSFQENLGFELVQTFQSDPSIGPVRINTQFAEEAFTVYDHPKVFIFKKTDAYDNQHVQEVLGKVDLNRVIRVTPKRASAHPADLMLPVERRVEQQAGGTWSEIFDTQAIQNRSQPMGVIFWYVALFVLGAAVYPLVRLGLSGLPDRGYPLARIAGLLLLAFLSWIAGSLRIPFTQITVAGAFLLILILGAVLAYFQREGLLIEWRERRRHFFIVEGLFLGFFLFGLLLRLANPDLWHPFFGGEKPMDFAYFNAVLKSTTFPPYDPWFSGGYLNYYYYGFVLVGVLTKLLAIVPAIAINLILPTIFAMIALGAFSIAWNLYTSGRRNEDEENKTVLEISLSPYLVGLAGALFMVVLGNLGTVRMILIGFQRLAAPGGTIDGADLFSRLFWMAQGFGRALSGTSLPYPRHDWYWIPSRVMAPGDYAITEFPFFTVLYADPHAHLFAMPVALLALGFAVSVVLSRARWRGMLGWGAALFLGGLAIGALYPINLSDIYTYLPLGIAAIIYSTWRYYQPGKDGFLNRIPTIARRAAVLAAAVLFLVGLAFLLYQPYRLWYGQGYSSIVPWTGIRTPAGSYITHWGMFLFIFVSWFAWETREWMASTPLSALSKLAPYKTAIQGAAVLLLILTGVLLYIGVHIAWMALPLAAWGGVLLLRPGMPDARRIALFLVGTGLAITVMVELVEVQGDINRMNTVFKFYLQAWTLFAVSAAAAVGWMAVSLHRWSQAWRIAWQLPLIVLIFSGALYTLLGGMAKINDRMAPQAPYTLDGMTYMRYSTYDNLGTLIDLDQDYHGIRWMQENITGSPTIVEASSGGNQYRWFSRYSIYTGLPGVIGWEWHQVQQRVLVPFNWPVERGREIDNFYRTVELSEVVHFLDKYDVSYIILGQVERGVYPGAGLEKFSEQDGVLWQEVYRDRDTLIYRVIR